MFNPLSTTTTIIPLRKKTALLKNNSQNDRNIHFHLITFPNGISVEEYGLPIIKTLQDIENLPKFEVISIYKDLILNIIIIMFYWRFIYEIY